MKSLLCVLGVLCGLFFSGCNSTKKLPGLQELMNIPIAPAITNAVPSLPSTPSTTSTESAVSWPHVYCADYSAHNVDGENERRQAAHDAAAANGTRCVRFDFAEMTNELAIHIFKGSLEKPGHFLQQDSWYWKGRNSGQVTRWQLFIPNCTPARADRALYLVGQNDKTDMQFVVPSATAADVLAKLRATGKDVVIE